MTQIRNTKGLLKSSSSTSAERRESARRAGIASGAARREKSELRRRVLEIANSPAMIEELKQQAEEMGLPHTTNLDLLVASTLRAALYGDTRAAERLIKWGGLHVEVVEAETIHIVDDMTTTEIIAALKAAK